MRIPSALGRPASRAALRVGRRHRRALGRARELAWQRRALALDPDRVEAMRRAARLLQDAGDDGARALWTRLTEIAPHHAEGWAELAWLALRDGDREAALRLARSGARLAEDEGRPFGPGHRLASIRAELERGEPPSPPRHVAVCGVTHCGSTIMSLLLGSLPGAGNVGESHRLVTQRRGPRTDWIDFAASDPGRVFWCRRCGESCSLLTWDLRRSLAGDPSGWYGKIARAMGVGLLISSDKGQRKLACLDPLLRFDALVLFRDPAAVYASQLRNPHGRHDVERFLDSYESGYLRLLNDLPARGRNLVLDFDRFRAAPGPHLVQLGNALELPLTADLPDRIRSDQHWMGGSQRANRTARGEIKGIVAQDPIELPQAVRGRIAEFTARSSLLRELRGRHRETFGGA